jgi:hypothetical protein
MDSSILNIVRSHLMYLDTGSCLSYNGPNYRLYSMNRYLRLCNRYSLGRVPTIEKVV